MFLSILIPTYNRSFYLEKNLINLSNIINNSIYKNSIELIISNNCSVDNTSEILEKWTKIKLNYINQNINIGPVENCIFLLNQAKGKYVMFLGDDDYLSLNYIDIALSKIFENPEIYSVIPSTVSLFSDGRILEGRDFKSKSRIFNKGLLNCFLNSYKGTQLSGTIHFKEGLSEEYKLCKVSNLYPYVFFLSINCLRGKTFLLSEYPVTITQMESGTENVLYNYTNLIEEIFNNYKCLKRINYSFRVLLELQIIWKQPSRYLSTFKIYKLKGLIGFCRIFYNSDQITLVTKILFPIIVFVVLLKRVFIFLLKKI